MAEEPKLTFYADLIRAVLLEDLSKTRKCLQIPFGLFLIEIQEVGGVRSELYARDPDFQVLAVTENKNIHREQDRLLTDVSEGIGKDAPYGVVFRRLHQLA